MGVVYLIGVGLIGGITGHKLHIPAGGMVGAIIAIIIFKYLNSEQALSLPSGFVLFSQIAIGIAIGASFTSDFFQQLRAVMLPAFIAVFLLLSISGLIAFLLKRFTDLDTATVLLSMVPGGLTEMGSFALAFNAKGTVVLTIHLLRILAITVLVPLVMALIKK